MNFYVVMPFSVIDGKSFRTQNIPPNITKYTYKIIDILMPQRRKISISLQRLINTRNTFRKLELFHKRCTF
jgi:hypothetical protein